jgi:hypothetical protein
LNIRLRNLFIILLSIFLLTLIYGCSSDPDEKIMKDFIVNLNTSVLEQPTNVNFKIFEITNSFNKKINGEKFYCMEINYKFNYISNFHCNSSIKQAKEKEGMKTHYSFVKRGETWCGFKGWQD